MKRYRIGVLYGDGIGPEIVAAAVRVLDAAMAKAPGLTWDFVNLPMGWAAIKEMGTPMPKTTKEALTHCDGWIMGPHDSVSYPPELKGMIAPSGELRHDFDLYANVRPSRNFPGIDAMAKGTDIIIVRENTEGFYPDRNMYAGQGEWMPTPDTAISVGVFTRKAAERVAHWACRLAVTRRKHVTIVHKANVIRFGTGLFLEACRNIARQYPEVQVDDYHIDAMTAHLVRHPQDFDVIVTTNMFGDILSDLAGELTGSLGMSPSINAGDDRAMAQAAHGSAPDIAGRGIGNPIGEILSSAMLLGWMAERHQDARLTTVQRAIERAVAATLESGIRTPDLGGQATTDELADAVIARL